jgi:hypothetical protein
MSLSQEHSNVSEYSYFPSKSLHFICHPQAIYICSSTKYTELSNMFQQTLGYGYTQ